MAVEMDTTVRHNYRLLVGNTEIENLYSTFPYSTPGTSKYRDRIGAM